ncbi:site-specific DNA-methyltransferase [Lacihabitans sp. CCS-44]|uniref:site-specific DNA-methyltransferase n=1 Tax=Lacihabitans sp. CCS-44 TaxID=2487331 RepID=UPI0020CF6843|nr:site-specific DNA-methyltransferase [Lacihabitans sp. CCS-44]MCP9757323.1 site-specific DNA-methyltransferase [Lacihabitans sp. CCS-44]
MTKLKETLLDLLRKDERLFDEEGELKENLLRELIDQHDPQLIELLLNDETAQQKFFVPVGKAMIFKGNDLKFFVDENKLDNSYTQFENKIGLKVGSRLLREYRDVVLNFPYKDCVLEGGQSTEEGTDSYFEYNKEAGDYDEKKARRKEVFFNQILAKDEIDQLFEPKAFAKVRKYQKDENDSILESEAKEFSRNENGDIKDNLIIKGNNLLALHSLKEQFRGKVKLIYIDPPYNTGNDSFAYNDNFNHSSWLVFMKNRFEVAKELLKNEGTIAISIDHNELGYMIGLLDEIFGKENKKNIITIKRSSVSGAKVINPGVVNVSEFLVFYSKTPNVWTPNKVFRSKDRDDRYNNFIINIESNPEDWKYQSVLDAFSIFKGVQKSKLKNQLGSEYEVELENFFIDNKNRIIRFAGLDDKSISEGVKKTKYLSKIDTSKTFVFERENHNNYYLFNGNAILFFKDRLINVEGQWKFGEMISDIWDDVLPNDIHNEGNVTLRKGKKPERLLNRILDLCSNEGDLILDFHLGSGTTASVAHKMNRQYIGIEQLDYGDNDSTIRLKNVINGEQSGISKTVNWQGGGSFIYFELAKNNQNAFEKIEAASSYKELATFFDEMYEKYFLNYNVKIKDFKEKVSQEAAFKSLSLVRQKQIFGKMLDLNQLYVNRSDMEDGRFQLSENDIVATNNFYGI